MDPSDLDMFNKFMPSATPQAFGAVEEQTENEGGTNLADLILEKIAAHEAMSAARPAVASEHPPVPEILELHPKVVQVYST